MIIPFLSTFCVSVRTCSYCSVWYVYTAICLCQSINDLQQVSVSFLHPPFFSRPVTFFSYILQPSCDSLILLFHSIRPSCRQKTVKYSGILFCVVCLKDLQSISTINLLAFPFNLHLKPSHLLNLYSTKHRCIFNSITRNIVSKYNAPEIMILPASGNNDFTG